MGLLSFDPLLQPLILILHVTWAKVPKVFGTMVGTTSDHSNSIPGDANGGYSWFGSSNGNESNLCCPRWSNAAHVLTGCPLKRQLLPNDSTGAFNLRWELLVAIIGLGIMFLITIIVYCMSSRKETTPEEQ